MEKKTEGAWLIHHTKKIADVSQAADFEDVETAGKCGIFLSNLAATEDATINSLKVKAIARASNIKQTELESFKKILSDEQLIDFSSDGSIAVLGVTTSNALIHTANIFEGLNANSFQKAAIDLSENISELPKEETFLREYLADKHKLSNSDIGELFSQAEIIGFVDSENLDDNKKLFFNGNLFRKTGHFSAEKTTRILDSLIEEDKKKIYDIDALLSTAGCVPIEIAKRKLGEALFEKLLAIGMYDLNEVSNSREQKFFVTRPSAFAKFGNPFEEDAFDMAKAFVSSLYYGMNYSSPSRGRIVALRALLAKLVRGEEVGPATAIGEDYKILELRRVIAIRPEKGMYFMKLLKKDIGELALHVLEYGEAAETVVGGIVHTGSITRYQGPEKNRTLSRKRENPMSKKAVGDLLRTFRQ